MLHVDRCIQGHWSSWSTHLPTPLDDPDRFPEPVTCLLGSGGWDVTVPVVVDGNSDAVIRLVFHIAPLYLGRIRYDMRKLLFEVFGVPDDHTEAKRLYHDYLERAPVLKRCREYAAKVAAATEGSSMTPVEPLATMGPAGGPLLCDVCGKPQNLEGGGYNGVPADEAWRQNPRPGWESYVLGGVVILIETNGTLRVYHGYPGRSGCVLKADAASKDMRRLDLLSAYFKAEMPQNDNDGVLGDIDRVLFSYDPGLGVNGPVPSSTK